MSRATLGALLAQRVGPLRAQVERRIPLRFQGLISPDDVLQDVWVAAYRTVDGFQPRGPGAFEHWLATLAATKLTDALRGMRSLKRGGAFRQQAQARFNSFSSIFARLQSPERTPSGECRQVETAHLLCIALESLSEVRRQVVEMYYLEGLSHEEVAQRTGRTPAAVNNLLRRGLRQLREVLGSASQYLELSRAGR